MILVDGGRGLMTHGYAANIAHAMALAVDKPEIAGGKAYNCGDEIQLTQRQLVEVAAAELGVELECVSIPNGPSVHMIATLRTAQLQLMDISRLRTELGYRDVVPTIEAVRRTEPPSLFSAICFSQKAWPSSGLVTVRGAPSERTTPNSPLFGS